MEIKNIKSFGWENALVGMRLPKNSENKIDSIEKINNINLGYNDLKLLTKLTKAGKDHRKVLRMIHVQALINMPISWWIQYDTYKVGTTANSRSRMHKIGSRFLNENDFYLKNKISFFNDILNKINFYIKIYQDNQNINKKIAQEAWNIIIDILPMSYMQERMIDLNYEVLLNIFNARYNEKLKEEWNYFILSFALKCPYLWYLYISQFKEIIDLNYIKFYEKDKINKLLKNLKTK